MINSENLINSSIKSKEFNINKDNLSFKIKIELEDNKINIKILNYELKLNTEEFSILTDIKFKEINEVFEFIINEFSKSHLEINIKEIFDNKLLKLNFNLKEQNKNIELNLINNNINKDFIINEICNKYYNKNNSEKEINELKEKMNKLINEIKKLKSNQRVEQEIKNMKIINQSNKKKINFNNFILYSELTNNSYCSNNTNKTFIIFNSLNNILYLIYASDNISIISYNVITQKVVNEIKNAHKNYITNFRHCFIKNSKKDIIMSLSDVDNNLKLWNPTIWECILNLENVNNQGFLNSACFLNHNDNIYIITSNWNFLNIEKIKVFDIKGEKYKEINDSNDKTVYIKSYYDIKNLKYYIITGNDGYIKSYDFYENKFYHKYFQKNACNSYYCLIIKNYKNILEIIGSCFDGFLRIWDFHSGDILNSIYTGNKGLIGICLLTDNYLFCGSNDKLLKVIDLEKGNIVKKYLGLKGILCTLKIIKHPKFGESLVTQGLSNDQIKLWYFKNN